MDFGLVVKIADDLKRDAQDMLGDAAEVDQEIQRRTSVNGRQLGMVMSLLVFHVMKTPEPIREEVCVAITGLLRESVKGKK